MQQSARVLMVGGREADVDDGAREEFAAFVAARSSSLIRIAYVLTGDQHAAEDLLQTALTKAATRWGRIHTAPDAYVRQVMYREQVNVWRRRSRRRETSTADLPDLAAAAPALHPVYGPRGVLNACGVD